ncbi:MAG: PPOX class F420-dependent oxidoreductase [Ktedonobacteraceae bacterium]
MTVSNTSTQDKSSDPFTNLYQYRYVKLTTFRKNGTAVPTPVWFGTDHGKLYIMTNYNAGKIKRIRSNERVLLAPSNGRGKVLGEQIEAHAHELPASEYKQAIALLVRKYGLIYRLFTFVQNLQKVSRTYIEIEPV